ncbi:DUF6088 family protein [Ohessyouella blattaphilus]|uniref:DUF6088 family protein n=1 Tax=Ohessyouella blattaphilus TaxID=2949333 RepID=A0ABT1EDY3_9FIRM|nr:DUF6088 family protein [Ohessyouella blattaphilus]MCP1108909.1 DUF6088 family protein [Ohessyouella blattaphilus]MCR8562303.1 DUF6088 family protein [Ohessyouella blattaphilus]MDL2249040.1 DUF6088 family protein [Lachnospiraceae bacterium OttesenSCG-928-J05]
MIRPKYLEQISQRIDSFEVGTAFTAVDFLDIASTDAINKGLSRINEEGKIRRVMQGVYDIPEYSNVLNEYSVPRIDKVAEAQARRYNWTIAPAGDTALNILHLSTQVSNKWHYVSDGPYRKYTIGKSTLEFRHVANREIAGMSTSTIMVIQAFRALGKYNIGEKEIGKLREVLTKTDKSILINEAKTSTAWIYEFVKKVSWEDAR